jgi:hypothetical protein
MIFITWYTESEIRVSSLPAIFSLLFALRRRRQIDLGFFITKLFFNRRLYINMRCFCSSSSSSLSRRYRDSPPQIGPPQWFVGLGYCCHVTLTTPSLSSSSSQRSLVAVIIVLMMRPPPPLAEEVATAA